MTTLFLYRFATHYKEGHTKMIKTIFQYNKHLKLIYSTEHKKHFIKSFSNGLNLTFELSKTQEKKLNKYNQLPKEINKDKLIITNERIIKEKNKKSLIITNYKTNDKIQISKYKTSFDILYSCLFLMILPFYK